MEHATTGKKGKENTHEEGKKSTVKEGETKKEAEKERNEGKIAASSTGYHHHTSSS